MNRVRVGTALIAVVAIFGLMGDDCNEEHKKSSDGVQQAQQEKLLQEGTAQVGMPAIKNFRERKLLKDILELRDQTGLTTYTYIWSDYHACHIWVCDSIGYGIPYATEFTNPQKLVATNCSQCEHMSLPQADPNGLFSPASADGTWVMCKDPNGESVKPVFFEPRMTVSPFKLATCSTDPNADVKKK